MNTTTIKTANKPDFEFFEKALSQALKVLSGSYIITRDETMLQCQLEGEKSPSVRVLFFDEPRSIMGVLAAYYYQFEMLDEEGIWKEDDCDDDIYELAIVIVGKIAWERARKEMDALYDELD